MSSVHNPSTSSEKVIIEDGKDRISELPDAILVHILSFLPTKSVVDKSILSPRWRNLWASVPVLDFDDRSHSEYRNVDVPLPARVPYGLMNFVDKVLLLHDFSSLSKFRLQCRGRIDLSRLHAWLMNVVHHLIKEIDVKIRTHNGNGCVYLPQSFCTSKTLVVLRLGYRLRIQLPSSVWFPSLKILEISLLHPENNMIQKLLSSCPILEDLIVGVFFAKAGKMVLNVAISTLKRLEIRLHPGTVVDYHDCKIMLDTPSLENLSLDDAYLVCYSVKNMSSLVKASVDIGECWSMSETKVHANCIHDILKGLSTVKSLSFFCFTMDVLDVADDKNLPMFHNLIHMRTQMLVQFHTAWPLLLKLLKSMPNLEQLELALGYPEGDDVDVNYEKFIAVESQEVPSCLLSHLKEIKVSDFDGWKDEMNLVKYLLKNAKVLEKITIDSSNEIKAKEKFRKKLLSLPKGSKTCRIKFS